MRFLALVSVTMLACCAATPNQSRADQLCGITKNEQLDRGWTALAPPEDAGEYRTIVAEHLNAPDPHEREYWYRAADGVTRVCIVDARRGGYGACTGGWTDVRDTDSGPAYVDSGEWICVS